MSEHSRRNLFRAGAVASVAALQPAPALAHAARVGCAPPLGPVRVHPGDPRYEDLVRRGNRRFVGTPDEVRVVGSTQQVVEAVREAVRSRRRVAVRSGGHGFEGFVDDPGVRVVIDLSGLTGVYFDPRRSAFAVEAGATLGEVYRRLYLGWGVTIPGGSCPGVGVGGHIAGGGYGRLSRLHGLAADFLHAIEIVVVTAAGDVRAVVASREPADPHRELWWAHTGGGGGNFGVVTRYWFRSLPQPPARVVNFTVTWPWAGMDERDFHRLAGNFGTWCERHSAPGAPQARLYSELVLTSRSAGAHLLTGQVPGDAGPLLDEHVTAVGAGVGVTPVRSQETLPWLAATLGKDSDDGKGWRLKVKSAFHRTGLTGRQLAAAYHHLALVGDDAPARSMSLNTYGGAINSVPPAATATARRDATMLLFYLTGWTDPAEDDRHLGRLREFYRDMYADTHGVPAGGAYINYPDVDLADPAWNRSGRPWSALYYGDRYARLQAVKAHWDPRDVFRHALSVRRA
ncbi:FAD-binding oxidoreductase [Amycolatopsis sp. MtRt-6]|uniref:FAD-binding oxidoreductase n=1 Tax=Amycolatopsis sp. MtRt-6 TaxID=2792782 RepID=UPI001A8C9A7E|nr:FAD-binding protein [Amycolatopsis sp. MtRt-6]